MTICNELPETLCFRIVHTGKLLLKTMNVVFAGITKEITFEQMGVLYYMARNQGKEVIQQDIAELMEKNKSAVLRSIDILEEKGFVRRIRVVGDRRKNILEITDDGKNIVAKMHQILLQQDTVLKSGIDEMELESSIKVLDAVQKKCR